MENTQKLLYGAVGLILTIAVIGFGVSIYQRVTKMNTSFNEEMSEAEYKLRYEEVLRYSGQTIPGSTAVGYIQTAWKKLSKVMLYTPHTGASGKDLKNATDNYSESTLLAGLLNSTGPIYIDPRKNYKVTVVYNTTGDTSQIDYVKIEEQ